MAREQVYLVIRADHSIRAARKPRLGFDEVAIPIMLNFPDTWGRIVDMNVGEVRVPDYAPDSVEIEPSNEAKEGDPVEVQ